MGDGRRTGGGGASAPGPDEAVDGWGLHIGPCLGVGDGRRTDGWGLFGLDGLNRLGLELGVIWSF